MALSKLKGKVPFWAIMSAIIGLILLVLSRTVSPLNSGIPTDLGIKINPVTTITPYNIVSNLKPITWILFVLGLFLVGVFLVTVIYNTVVAYKEGKNT